MTTAIERSSRAELPKLAQLIWRAHAAGSLTDDDAQGLAEAIEARKAPPAAQSSPAAATRRRSVFPPKRRQRSPDREASRLRRRTLASAGPLPPALAARFTEGERAVLYVLSEEVLDNGACDRSIDELAARAGVSRSTAKNALRQAERLALVAITRRPQKGRKSLTNVVAIVSKEWRLWLERRPCTGGKAQPATDKTNTFKAPKSIGQISSRRISRGEGRSQAPRSRSGETLRFPLSAF